jgi:hypothetical protein
MMQWGGGCENHGVVFFMQEGWIAGFELGVWKIREPLTAIVLHFARTAIEKRGSSGCKAYLISSLRCRLNPKKTRYLRFPRDRDARSVGAKAEAAFCNPF